MNDENEEERKEEKTKIVKSININTPYVSVTVSSEDTDDTLNDIKRTTETLLDKYKHHHLVKDGRADYS